MVPKGTYTLIIRVYKLIYMKQKLLDYIDGLTSITIHTSNKIIKIKKKKR